MADTTKKAAAGDNNHRIRITLTSRNPQSLEKGKVFVYPLKGIPETEEGTKQKRRERERKEKKSTTQTNPHIP